MPEEFYPFLSDSCLPDLSEQFSRSSHEGEFDNAILAGQRLLAFYRMVYTRNFPQIGKPDVERLHEVTEHLHSGMHALELAKTAWNAVVTMENKADPSVVQHFEDTARTSITIAAQILENFGIEGDEGGPLEELRMLRDLLGENTAT